MSPQIIFESAHLKVMFRRGSSAYALITFNPATLEAKGTRYWCESIADKADLTTFGVMTPDSNWYAAEDMRKLAEVMAPLLAGFRQVIAYGSSMGGYGALKYGRMLGATHVLSFAPQWSIAPSDVGEWDLRFLDAYRTEFHQGMRISPGDSVLNPIVFYDPFFEVDRLNVDRIVETCESTQTVRAYLTGHFPVNVFAGTEKVLALFDMCLTGDIESIRRRSTELRRERTLPLRVQVLAQSFIKTNIKAAFRLFERYPDAYGPRERAAFYHQMAGTHIARKEWSDAARCSDAALADLPTVRDFYIRRSMIEERRDDLDAALSFAQQAVTRWPKDVQTHIRLSDVETLRGNAPASEAALKHALELDPKSAHVIRSMIKDVNARGDNAAGLLWARRLVEVAPTSNSYGQLAERLAQASKHEDACEMLRHACAISPGVPQFWIHLAKSYIQAHRFIKAAEAAAEAAKLSPSNLTAHRIAVASYERMGMREFAASHRQAIEALTAIPRRKVAASPKAVVRRRLWLKRLPFVGRKKALSYR